MCNANGLMEPFIDNSHLGRMLQDRMHSFSPLYWLNTYGEDTHYNFMKKLSGQVDARLLYKAWAWTCFLKENGFESRNGTVCELLPGPSLVVPLALCFLNGSERLVQFDKRPVEVQNLFPKLIIEKKSFDIWTDNIDIASFDLIVGNHIIDDLMLDLFDGRDNSYRSFYNDKFERKNAWKSIVANNLVEKFVTQIANLIEGYTRRMNPGSCFILRHYPSSMGLSAMDSGQVSFELNVLSYLLARIPGSELREDTHYALPEGAKYGKSFWLYKAPAR